MVCPVCRSELCYRSHRRGLADRVMSVAGLRPWRCTTCEGRFYAWRVAASLWRYAHCPRCGSFDLQAISARRLDGRGLGRLLGLLNPPAYRCDSCREEFFSLQPHHRIVPAPAEGSHKPSRSAG